MRETKATLEAQIRAGAALIAAAQEKLEQIQNFGEDEWPLDTVLTWEKKFSDDKDATVYTYIALKARNGYWYVTGMTHRNARTWEELIEWITEAGKVISMHVAAAWESVL